MKSQLFQHSKTVYFLPDIALLITDETIIDNARPWNNRRPNLQLKRPGYIQPWKFAEKSSSQNGD